MDKGRFLEAYQLFEEIIKEYPKNIHALQGAAMSAASMGDYLNAGRIFESATAVSPREELYFNGGKAYFDAGDIEASISMFDRCRLQKGKLLRHCLVKLASIHRDMEHFDKVQVLLQEAIATDPTSPEAYNYLADTYNNMKQFQLAVETYEKAIRYSPKDPNLWISLGDTYSNLKKLESAAKSYSKARKFVMPGSKEALAALIGYFFNAQDMGYWRYWERDMVELLQLTMANVEYNEKGQAPPSALSPYRMIFIDSQASLAYRVALGWSKGLLEGSQPLLPSPPPTQGTSNPPSSGASSSSSSLPSSNCKLNIGYVSRRFEDYPGTQLMLQLFGSHNRSNVCVHSYGTGVDDQSSFRAIVRNTSDVFSDLSRLSSLDGAQKIRNENVDVLIDYGEFASLFELHSFIFFFPFRLISVYLSICVKTDCTIITT